MLASEDLSFRPLRPKRDLAFLSKVYKSTREWEFGTIDWSPQQIDAFLQSQFEIQHRYYTQTWPDAEYLVILKARLKIGRLYKEERENEIRVIDIALLPQHRGQGIGSYIMQSIIDHGEACDKVTRIHVEKNNPAQSLYRRLGFARIGGTEVYDLMEWSNRCEASKLGLERGAR